jgi:hypothetical protein
MRSSCAASPAQRLEMGCLSVSRGGPLWGRWLGRSAGAVCWCGCVVKQRRPAAGRAFVCSRASTTRPPACAAGGWPPAASGTRRWRALAGAQAAPPPAAAGQAGTGRPVGLHAKHWPVPGRRSPGPASCSEAAAPTCCAACCCRSTCCLSAARCCSCRLLSSSRCHWGLPQGAWEPGVGAAGLAGGPWPASEPHRISCGGRPPAAGADGAPAQQRRQQQNRRPRRRWQSPAKPSRTHAAPRRQQAASAAQPSPPSISSRLSSRLSVPLLPAAAPGWPASCA